MKHFNNLTKKDLTETVRLIKSFDVHYLFLIPSHFTFYIKMTEKVKGYYN